jgi:anti-sigma factor RsiW
MMLSPVCWLIRKRLDAFHDAELGSVARAKTEAHLSRCPACAEELAVLGRLHAAVAMEAPELPEARWGAFWPQVRDRIATAPPESLPGRATWWPSLGPWRLALGSGLAAAALGILAVLAPWQPEPQRPQPPVTAKTLAPSAPAIQTVRIESLETADPRSSVMVYNNPESEMTVIWVFGLEPTKI